jgi:1-acyl-sn-glycerol-3-phosphate acyltransferase
MLKAAGAALGLGAPGREVDDWGKDLALSRSLRPVADLLFERYWRVQTSGLEHVPAGPCVLVANHAGALPLDGPLLHLALRRGRPELPDARWLLEDQLFFAPLVGGLANRLGAVRATPENAHRLLDEGRPLIVFPEGLPGLSRSFAERHRLSRFGRGGYLKVALRAGVPVVPVALLGGGESTPLLARLPGGAFGFEYLPLTPPPLPARWFVRFGAPVSLDGLPADPDGDPVAIEARNLEVRDAVQALLDALVSERKGVFS